MRRLSNDVLENYPGYFTVVVRDSDGREIVANINPEQVYCWAYYADDSQREDWEDETFNIEATSRTYDRIIKKLREAGADLPEFA